MDDQHGSRKGEGQPKYFGNGVKSMKRTIFLQVKVDGHGHIPFGVWRSEERLYLPPLSDIHLDVLGLGTFGLGHQDFQDTFPICRLKLAPLDEGG